MPGSSRAAHVPLSLDIGLNSEALSAFTPGDLTAPEAEFLKGQGVVDAIFGSTLSGPTTPRVIHAAVASAAEERDWLIAASRLPSRKEWISFQEGFWMFLYGVGALIFLLRFFHIGYTADAIVPTISGTQLFPYRVHNVFYIGLALVYVVIGIVLPLLSFRVARSRTLSEMLVHRHKYYKCKPVTLRRVLVFAYFLSPLCKLASLLAPLQVFVLRWESYAWQSEWLNLDQFSFCAATIAVAVMSLAGVLVFGACTVDHLAVEASIVALAGLKDEIEAGLPVEAGLPFTPLSDADDDSQDSDTDQSNDSEFVCATSPTSQTRQRREGRDYDTDYVCVTSPRRQMGQQLELKNWRKIARHHNVLSRALAQLWSLHCAGLPWLIRCLVLFVASLVLIAVGVTVNDARIRWTLILCGIALAVLGTSLLLQLAGASSMGLNGAADADSVKSTAARWMQAFDQPGRSICSESKFEYKMYMDYALAFPLGITISGVVVDYGFVCCLAAKTIVYIPTFLVSIGAILMEEKFESQS